MKRWADRVLAYGVPWEPGTVECVDCGHRQEHVRRGALPPCPHYRDSTHARAAWRPVTGGEAPREDGRTSSG